MKSEMYNSVLCIVRNVFLMLISLPDLNAPEESEKKRQREDSASGSSLAVVLKSSIVAPGDPWELPQWLRVNACAVT